jgi:hypothetical protein
MDYHNEIPVGASSPAINFLVHIERKIKYY